jgi:hypothetical protein
MTVYVGADDLVFDLRASQRKGWTEGVSRFHYVAALVALVVSLLLFGTLYYYKFRSQGFTFDSLASLPPGALAVGVLVWGIRFSALGASELRISRDAVRLQFPSGKQRVYGFSDPHLRLVIRGSERPGLGVRQWRISGGLPYRTYIPLEARDALVSVASRAGLSVARGTSQGETVFTIRARRI